MQIFSSKLFFTTIIFLSLPTLANDESFLRFCRVLEEGMPQTYLIKKVEEDYVYGVKVTDFVGDQSPLLALQDRGFDRFWSLLNKAQIVKISRNNLIRPLGLENEHVAAGGNFPEHAKESALEDIFLFPKYSSVSDPISIVETGHNVLLDYEAEICAVFSKDIKNMDDYHSSIKGLLLCGDYSDRATLLRNIDTDNVESGRGFTDAKSGKGMLPIGEFLVIPLNFKGFSKNIGFSLSLNGDIKQKSNTEKMVLDFELLVQAAIGSKLKGNWIYKKREVPLLNGKTIKRGQLVMSGTPEGIIFQKFSTFYKIKKGIKWFFSLSFLNIAPVSFVIEEYIKESFDNELYLKDGDKILMSADYLGRSLQTIRKKSAR